MAEAFVAGWFAGVVNLFVGHPFDTGKVRQQAGQSFVSDLKFTHGSKEFFKSVRFAYRGITGPLLTTGFSHSILFGTWRWGKDFVKSLITP